MKKTQCRTPSIRNQAIEDAFVAAINRAIEQKDEIISICEKVISERCETTEIEAKLISLHAKLDTVNALMRNSIYNNARTSMNQGEYNQLFSEYGIPERFNSGEHCCIEGTENGASRKEKQYSEVHSYPAFPR